MHAKMRKFSRTLEIHGSYLSKRGFTMWHWAEHTPFRGRSSDRPPGPVADDLYQRGTFVIVGKHAPFDTFDAGRVLQDFDTLLPIYEYVEAGPDVGPLALSERGPFVFTRDQEVDASQPPPITWRTRKPDETEVAYAHRRMQNVLKQQLIAEGAEIGTEHPDGNGRYIDLVACRDGTLEFYEIKSAKNRDFVSARPLDNCSSTDTGEMRSGQPVSSWPETSSSTPKPKRTFAP